ncbi:hypothetical protein DPMN_053115, partial [Dreissena polymorpha]
MYQYYGLGASPQAKNLICRSFLREGEGKKILHPTKAIDPIDYKIQQGITCFRMICKCCGERLLDHEPFCVNCGIQNRQIKEAKDQGATGGVDVQLRTKRINDNAVESHVSHNERLQKKHARVLYSFNPALDDELALKVGDVVEILCQDPKGWWMAELNGKRGVIPSNYVKIMEIGETARAHAADDELALKVGDVVEILCQDPKGWWMAELNGKRGVIPSNYVKIMEIGETARAHAADQGATGGVDVRLRTKRINDNAVESHVSHNERSQKKHARVFFSFNPTSDDELALKVGDIVELVKQVCDAWWMAELNGKRGLIPANYVNVIEEGETAGANAADKQADDFADDLSDLEDGSDFIENEDL